MHLGTSDLDSKTKKYSIHAIMNISSSLSSTLISGANGLLPPSPLCVRLRSSPLPWASMAVSWMHLKPK